ncbi:MAG: methyltransferase [Prevotellaceae bacterium]|jgi:tRNA1Val (adenine37-N6)-methyltransferase|nr:methyltransferase [Prevotellaceae bacterium]
MANAYFAFKQFTVWHDRCAMKVGTDGVLLGAWAGSGGSDVLSDAQAHSNRQAVYILDVGTGSGLIALMLAQRFPSAHITAIEIDPAAAQQATDNMERSPWADRIAVKCMDFRSFATDSAPFDLIVSNPPYFVDALHSPDRQRNLARHAQELNYEQLLSVSATQLSPDGNICLIVPAEMEQVVVDTAWRHRLFPQRRLSVFTRKGKPCRRVLLSLGFESRAVMGETLCLETTSGIRTPEYATLMREFYLK